MALKPETFFEALRTLSGQPAHHTYLLGAMEQNGPDLFQGAHRWFGLRGPDEADGLSGVAYLGRTAHLCWPQAPERAPIAEIARNFFDPAATIRIQALVGPNALITRLREYLETMGYLPDHARPPGQETRRLIDRGPQIVMEVTGQSISLSARSSTLAPSQHADLPALFVADRAMIRDELGVDTLGFTPEDYWDAGLVRIEDHRTWSIRGPDGALYFKADIAAQSSEASFIAGVFTTPAMRQRGFARAGVGELCHYLLRARPRVMLAVYEDNAPALALYKSLGFRSVARTRSVWFI